MGDPATALPTFTGQTRRVLTVALFALTAATELVPRSAEPSTTLIADVHHPTTRLWLAPLLLGIGPAAVTPYWLTLGCPPPCRTW
ncbi:hypothetical protein [Streptomyces sp. NPDC002550]